MELYKQKLTEDMAKELFDWKYSGEYSVYNYPSWSIACKANFGITKEDIRNKEFLALVDEKNNLCGYMRMKEDIEFIAIGVGLKPSLCGQGLGNKLMSILLDECNNRYGNKKIRLEVRSFNKRAIKSYKKAGFKVTSTCVRETQMGKDEFVTMEYTS